MSAPDYRKQVKELITNGQEVLSAVHGTSIGFVEKIIKVGQIYNEGNFGNYFYVLVPTDTLGVDIIESATYYANVNAIKDMLFSWDENFRQKVAENIDQYLFLTGLGQMADNPTEEKIIGFDIFSSTERDFIKQGISRAKMEDRQEIIVYFKESFLKDFDIVETTDTGQAKIFLNKPINIDHLAGIQPLGNLA